MGIFDRMGKVISSNVNSLLDKAEDEHKLLELNLEEMEQQLRRGRQEVVSAVAGEKQLRKKVDELRAEVDSWDKRAELALKSGDESLAREALKQKRRATGDAEVADRNRGEQRDLALKLKGELERMEGKLAEFKMRKGTLASRAEQAKAGAGSSLGTRGGSDAFANFREMEERIEGREAQSAAMAEVEDAIGKGPAAGDLEARFREMEREQGKGGGGTTDVDDDLAALKKRIRI